MSFILQTTIIGKRTKTSVAKQCINQPFISGQRYSSRLFEKRKEKEFGLACCYFNSQWGHSPLKKWYIFKRRLCTAPKMSPGVVSDVEADSGRIQERLARLQELRNNIQDQEQGLDTRYQARNM
jgi:hypothetical protein